MMPKKTVAMLQLFGGIVGVALISHELELSYPLRIGLWLIVYTLTPCII